MENKRRDDSWPIDVRGKKQRTIGEKRAGKRRSRRTRVTVGGGRLDIGGPEMAGEDEKKKLSGEEAQGLDGQ
jgi:hypothetical protein